jgi:5'-nucleotidase
MRQRFQRLLISVFAVLCGVAILVGCGSDDDDESRVLRILVTNDDGVGAEGIDAVVEALIADPRNEVMVCAPESNRSGSSDQTGPSDFCGDLAVRAATTASGYPATSVNGCPADSVIYALQSLYPADAPPDLVVSGLNEGQNHSVAIAGISGTVGAAKTASRMGVPAVATSQGIPEPDYETGVDVVLEWLDEHRGEILRGFDPIDIASINVPSCLDGSLRGTISGLPLAEQAAGAFDEPNCIDEPAEPPTTDVEAFLDGYATVTAVGLD